MTKQNVNNSECSRRRLLKGAASATLITALPVASLLAKPISTDVLILGAGLAGLNAALNLEDSGFSVRVIEGSNRVGGRLFTAPESEVPGHPELGGSGIGANYARIKYVANRFGVGLENARPRTEPRKGEVMYHVRGAGILKDDWPEHRLNPFVQEKNRKLSLTSSQFMIYGDNPLPLGDLEAWQSGKYGSHDISVHDYMVQKGYAPQAIKLAAGTNMSYGTSSHDLSVLMGFQSSNLVKSIYSKEDLSKPAQAAVGGNQRIPEAMADGLKSEVLLGQHIRAIRSHSSGVEVTCADGAVHRARYCICSLPFSALKHIHIDPFLQGKQAQAINHLAYTPVFQVHFVPTREFWQQDRLPPSMWTDQSPGRFMALKNDPVNPDRITSYISFVNGKMALYLDRLDPQVAVQTILRDLARMRPATSGALKPVKVWSWNRNPFAGGAYAYWKPGQITQFSKQMRDPWGRIHFAGEHTAVMNRGMEGAMESGERASFEVMDLIT